MGNFGIQINGGSLDIYKQDINWSWTNIRFGDGIRNQYTNDITLPKTTRNMNLLGVSGLLDSPVQLFGNEIKPCVICVNGNTMDAYLQIASIGEKDIKVCLFERTLVSKDRERNVSRLVKDNDNTILAWNTNTLSAYPQWFLEYHYGMPYDPKYAQLHPIRPVNDFVSAVHTEIGLDMEEMPTNWYVMATKKTVCPQNKRQTLEGLYSDEGFAIMGGQHITNDLSFDYGNGDTDRITFNRDCTVNINLWISWQAKAANGYNIPFLVNHWSAETHTNNTVQTQLRGDLYTNYVDVVQMSFNVKKDDHISFGVVNGNRFEMVRCLADLLISDYTITEDDYGQELEYVSRLPRLVVYNYASGGYYYWYFDSTEYDLAWHTRGVSGTKHKYVPTAWTSFAWFGYWCNVPDMKLEDFIWGLCWLLGKKPILQNGSLVFVEPNETAMLKEAKITNIETSTDLFGQENFVVYDGEDSPQSISIIPNTWLEGKKNLHQSPFGWVKNLSQFKGGVMQYTNPNYDKESEKYSCDFSDVGFLVWQNVTQAGNITVISPYIRDIPLKNFGLEQITQTMKCTVETTYFGNVDKDYLYYNGRKFMVVEGNADLNNGTTTITAMLVPSTD